MSGRWSGLFRRREKAKSSEAGAKRALPLASAALLVGGAGVAFWWYTQWAHGQGDGGGDQDADKITPILPSAATADLEQSLAVQANDEP